MYEYPKELIDFLTEQESEGSEIFITQNDYGTIWIIPQKGIPDHYTLMEWQNGAETWQHIELCGKAVNRLRNVMAEQE